MDGEGPQSTSGLSLPILPGKAFVVATVNGPEMVGLESLSLQFKTQNLLIRTFFSCLFDMCSQLFFLSRKVFKIVSGAFNCLF